MMGSEWRVKYLIEPRHPWAPEMRQRDEAIEDAIFRARHDVPDADVAVLYTRQTPKGKWSVEVLRRRGDA